MYRFAAQNLLSRPVRSLLALLGLTVAITGMVGLFSIAAGINDTVTQTFGRIPGLAAMQPGAPIPLFSRLPASWADEIEHLKGVRVARPEIWARAQLVEEYGHAGLSRVRQPAGLVAHRLGGQP